MAQTITEMLLQQQPDDEAERQRIAQMRGFAMLGAGSRLTRPVSEMLMQTSDADEKRRLRRQRDLATLGMLMGTQPTTRAAELLNNQAGVDVEVLQRAQERAAAAEQRAQERAADAAWKQQVQNDLNAYRKNSLAAYGRGAQSTDDGLTPYQRKMLERQAAQDKRQADLDQLAAQEKRQGRMVDLSQAIEKSGMGELSQSVYDANELLASYHGKDIPGIGAGNVPLIGKYAGGEEGRKVRATLQAVVNAVLKARSGGAVTPQEADRLNAELGVMLGGTDEDLLNAWPGFIQRHNARLSNILAPYRDVYGDYTKNNPGFRGQVNWSPPNARAQGAGTQRVQPAPGQGAAPAQAAPTQDADYDFVNGKFVPRRR